MKRNKTRIDEQRELRVVKSNDMIRKGRFNLSLVEQRIVLYLISKIKPNDQEIKSVFFSIRDFCDVCGIKYNENHSQLKEVIKTLADKSMWVRLADGRKTIVRWIEKPYLTEGCAGILEIKLDDDMKPYLLNLANNFTEYQLISVLALKSKNSVRLYELCKSYAFMGQFSMTLAEIRDYLQIGDKYPEVKYFNKYVLDKGIDEINRFTDIEVSYSVQRSGRFIKGYDFTVIPQETNDFIMARASLSGKIPSRHKQEQDFREFIKSYTIEGQASMFDDGEVENG